MTYGTGITTEGCSTGTTWWTEETSSAGTEASSTGTKATETTISGGLVTETATAYETATSWMTSWMTSETEGDGNR